MSDEEDDQMDETEAEKEAQYGFELENGTFLLKFLDIFHMHLFQKIDHFLDLILNLRVSIVWFEHFGGKIMEICHFSRFLT